jgi:hypothetical protein
MRKRYAKVVCRSLAIGLVFAGFLGLAGAAAAAQAVAIVTDVSGRVTGQESVTIMYEIAADARVQVEAGARLVAIYLKSGDEYSFAGPAQIQFRAAQPLVLSGAQPKKRSSPVAKAGGFAIKPAGVAGAAFIMRSAPPTARIKLLTLSGTKTLDISPEFRWQEIEPSVTYRFELTDNTGRSLHEAEVQMSSFRLPDSVRLRDNVGYTWVLSARTPDGRRYVSAGDFSIAAADLRAEAQRLRPAADALVSDRVAYAAWLEGAELRDEAKKFWKTLAFDRPEDAKLKVLGAE